MSRIIPNKLIYLFCWFTAATVLCLYSSGLKAAIIPPISTPTTENIQVSVSKNLTAATADSLSNISFYPERSTIKGDFPSTGDLIADKQVTCYPNPAVSYINFKFEKSVKSSCKLLVYSFTGRKMDEVSINGTIIKVNLDDYYRGLYVYQLRDERGAVLESGKFQVKK